MKNFKYVCKINKKFFALCLLMSLSFDLIVIGADLPNINTDGFWRPIIICLCITVIVAFIALLFVYRVYRKNRDFLRLLDQKGVCDELIDAYRRTYPNMSAMNHVVLASYLSALDRMEEAQQEMYAAGTMAMVDVRTKAYYSEIMISLHIKNRRFNDAITIYNNYNQMMEAYCRSNKNAVAAEHFAHGAVLYAYSGNFDAAMICIRKTEPSVKKDRSLAFTRNTALMGVYLIMGDYRSADNIKSLMLKDLETFSEFDFETFRALSYKDIEETQMLFDPRMQRQ